MNPTFSKGERYKKKRDYQIFSVKFSEKPHLLKRIVPTITSGETKIPSAEILFSSAKKKILSGVTKSNPRVCTCNLGSLHVLHRGVCTCYLEGSANTPISGRDFITLQ